jgi:N-acetylglucosaminyldiphosphoundecaprenol N-acetyl-beta-D-mannosaminyltransferase
VIANDAVVHAAAGTVHRTDFNRQVYCLLGLPFDALTLDQAESVLLDAVRAGRRNFFSTPNLNFLITAMGDATFRNSVLHSDLSLVDGMPIVWMARALRIPLRHRVAGSTVFEQLRRQRGTPLRVYFFGGPDGVARRAGDVLNSEAGGMVCVGAHAPGFGSIEDMSGPALIAEINAARPDFVLVALGAKRGQAWIERNLAALQAPLISHLGAVVNFVAGSIAQAPSKVSGLGLEWLWRIKEEPALWRRYWNDGTALLSLLARRVLPGALAARRADAGRHLAASPAVDLRSDNGWRLLTLSGDWHDGNLAPLRLAFSAATATRGAVALDLSAVTGLDSAALALLMLLYGHQSKTGQAYSTAGAGAALRDTLAQHCALYLLDPLKPIPQKAP